MTLSSRLDELTPTLSAKERAILILQAQKKGQRPHPSLWWNLPAGESDDFNFRIRLINVANRDIAFLLNYTEAVGESALLYSDFLVCLTLWRDYVVAVEQVLGNELAFARCAGRREKTNEACRNDVDPEEVRRPVDLASGLSDLIADLKRKLANEMGAAWVALRSVEKGLDEFATHFDGIDPLLPRLREKLNEAKDKLLELNSDLPSALHMKVVLREPSQKEMDEFNYFVEHGVVAKRT